MSVTVQLPEDLAAEIDSVAKDRSSFVAEAVRQALRERSVTHFAEEVARINSIAEELNREASEVLEYQVIR
jgi:metal-responsive CopG/Arc/MetJ family transcriptional regulator